jgi:hypothetical protein
MQNVVTVGTPEADEVVAVPPSYEAAYEPLLNPKDPRWNAPGAIGEPSVMATREDEPETDDVTGAFDGLMLSAMALVQFPASISMQAEPDVFGL